MIVKLIAGIIGLVALAGFLLPPIVQIKEVSMVVVGFIGVAMAAFEFYQSLRESEG